ncbi:MAG: hypothetical protein ACK4WB_08520, partial [Desulfatiglandales bacterium]
MRTTKIILLCLLVFGLLSGIALAENVNVVRKASFDKANQIIIEFIEEIDGAWAKDVNNFYVYQKINPDILIGVSKVELLPDKRTITLVMSEDLNKNEVHIVGMKNIKIGKQTFPKLQVQVKKFYFGYLFSIFIGA